MAVPVQPPSCGRSSSRDRQDGRRLDNRERQSQGIEGITSAMDQKKLLMQQNAATSEESASAAEERPSLVAGR
jgi:hypothetical protein